MARGAVVAPRRTSSGLGGGGLACRWAGRAPQPMGAGGERGGKEAALRHDSSQAARGTAGLRCRGCSWPGLGPRYFLSSVAARIPTGFLPQ